MFYSSDLRERPCVLQGKLRGKDGNHLRRSKQAAGLPGHHPGIVIHLFRIILK